MTLRPYQQQIIHSARQHMLSGRRRPLIVSPTGSGKTQLAAHMVGEAARRGRTSWFIVHREELVTSTVNTFRAGGISTGIIAAGHPDTEAPVQVCMVQSLPSRLRAPPDMLVIDESHHIASRSYQRITDHCASSYHLGLTATPIRGDGKPLGAYFDCIVLGPSVAWLMEQGWLSKYQYFAPDIPDLAGVPIRAGEYAEREVEQIMAGKAIVANMVNTWQARAASMITVGFAPTVALSQAYCEAFQAAGIASGHLDGTTERGARRAACAGLARREIQVLWNVGLFGEGVDLAALAGIDVTIEAVIMGSPTRSLVLNRQRIGRVLRPKARPAVILDHCGDITRHPLPDADIAWSLDSPARVSRPGGRITPVSRCAECFSIIPPTAVCPICGHARAVKERQVIYLEGDLKEIKAQDRADAKAADESRKRAQRIEVGRAKTLEELLKIERERGYRAGWARMKFSHRKKK